MKERANLPRSIAVWNIFHRKSPPEQQVTTGRFEIEQDGQTAYLDYSLTGNILELIHTEVPPPLRHLGLSSALAENALHFVVVEYRHGWLARAPARGLARVARRLFGLRLRRGIFLSR